MILFQVKKKDDSIYMIPRAPAAQYNYLLERLTLMPIVSINMHIHYAKIYVHFMIELPPKGLAAVTWRKDRSLFYLWAQSKANGTALNNEFLFSLLSL
jgi:hypothetical protein